MIFSYLMVKRIQLTLRKCKGSCTVSWLAKSRLGIRVFRSLNSTLEMYFENISAPNIAGGRSNSRVKKGGIQRHLVIDNSHHSRKIEMTAICKN